MHFSLLPCQQPVLPFQLQKRWELVKQLKSINQYGWWLTFIGDAEVDVDELVELSAELEVHFLSIFACFLFLEHRLDRRQTHHAGDEVHAIQLLNQSCFNLSSGLKHCFWKRHGLLWWRHRQDFQDKALLVCIVNHLSLAIVLDWVQNARHVVRLAPQVDCQIS